MDLMKMFDDLYKASKENDKEIDASSYIEKAEELFNELGCSEIFEKNKETLIVKEPANTSLEDRTVREADAGYNGSKNTINIYNMSVIYHELAHVASYKDEYNEGVLDKQGDYEFIVGKSFNEGFCDYIASKLDPNYQLRYPLEKLIVDKVINKFGDEPLKYFLTADYKDFHSFINEKGLNSLLSNMDTYTNYVSDLKNPEKLEAFYNSYNNIMSDLTTLCSNEEINQLKDDFLSTPKGTEIDIHLYEQEVRNVNKTKH